MELRIELTVTNVLIALNVLLFILTTFFEVSIFQIADLPYSYIDPPPANIESLMFLGADVYQLAIRGEVWRFLTSSFLHAGLIHLAINMYALFIFGNFFERQFSGKKLFSVYVIAGITGSILSFAITLFSVFVGLKDPSILKVGVGASGALFGILGYLLVTPNLNIDKQRLLSILLLNIFIGVMFHQIIDNGAHVGGLLGGMCISFVDFRFLKHHYHKLDKPVFYISIAITLLSFLALILNNIIRTFLL